jgi:hypothetical protein
MILDERNEFADAVSVAAAAGTALIGDVIDLGTAARDIGSSSPPLYLVIQTDTEIITGGSAGTIEFRLASDSTANLATSPTVHFSTGTLVTDDAAANDARLNAGGFIAIVPLPLGALYERYLGILAVIGTTTVTAGKINAFLTPDVSQYRAYADNVPN